MIAFIREHTRNTHLPLSDPVANLGRVEVREAKRKGREGFLHLAHEHAVHAENRELLQVLVTEVRALLGKDLVHDRDVALVEDLVADWVRRVVRVNAKLEPKHA